MHQRKNVVGSSPVLGLARSHWAALGVGCTIGRSKLRLAKQVFGSKFMLQNRPDGALNLDLGPNKKEQQKKNENRI